MRTAAALAALFAGLAALPARAADKPVSAEQAVLDAAPGVIDALKSAGVKHVGFLKFTAPKDGQAGTRNPGPLLARLSRDLESAVVLRLKAKDADKVVLLRDASGVAARLKGADHRTAAGRKVLFAATYPPAWGDETNRLMADAFLTAEVRVKDGRDLSIQVQLVTPDAAPKSVGAPLTAFADVDALIDMGVSFSLRGKGRSPAHGLKDNTDAPAVQAGEAAKVLAARAQSRKLVLEGLTPKAPLDELPLTLTVLYDGKPQPFSFDRTSDRNASVPEPTEAHNVTFLVRRRDPADTTLYGFVIRVNGINTVGKQKAEVSECRRWMLTPDMKELTVDGFYTPADGKGLVDAGVTPFRVASDEETRQLEADRLYGDESGTIDFAVFRSGTPSDKPAVETDPGSLTIAGADEAEQLRSMRRSAADLSKRYNNVVDRKADFKKRGLIREDGPTFQGTVRKVEFPDPVIVGSARVVYRLPEGLES